MRIRSVVGGVALLGLVAACELQTSDRYCDDVYYSDNGGGYGHYDCIGGGRGTGGYNPSSSSSSSGSSGAARDASANERSQDGGTGTVGRPRTDASYPADGSDGREPLDGATRSDAAPGRDSAETGPSRSSCDDVVCVASHGASKCVAGACVVLSCDPGYGDCNGNPADGCEPLSSFYPDADGDGHAVEGAPKQACSAPIGYAIVRDDCDDADARAFPGQLASFATARPSGSFDFNCDSREAPLYSRVDPQYCVCNAGICSISRGWQTTVPACGESSAFASETTTPEACDIRYRSLTQVCN